KIPFQTEDPGRFKVTGHESDRATFKVPSLRNITETGPYFHDGQVASLVEAVRLMGHHQLGKDLSDEEIGQIVAFLGSLKGELPKQYIGP
ncbi:MAG: c-type cytochrome, partial [Candidatus Eremiobacteraeota bacterium]|nr:c-type cytochrome [Candidatus Eremiobacteraeota bacterium]